MSPDESNSAKGNAAGAGRDDFSLDQATIDALLQAAMASDAESAPVAQGLNAEQALIGQAELDALLRDPDMDKPLNDAGVDSLVVSGSGSGGDAASLDQADIDSLISMASGDVVVLPAATPPVDLGALSQDMIDALVRAAGDGDKVQEEAPAPPPKKRSEDLLTQEEMDAMLAQAKIDEQERRAAKQRAMSESLADVKPKPHVAETPRIGMGSRFKWLRRPTWSRAELAKAGLAAAAAIVAAFGAFTYLYTHQEQALETPVAVTPKEDELAAELRPMENLRAATSAYEAASSAPPKPAASVDDAGFKRIEAAYRGLSPKADKAAIEKVREAINDFIDVNHAEPRLPEVIQWRADLWRREKMPHVARDILKTLLADFTTIPNKDAVLLAIAEMDAELGKYDEAQTFARRLMDECPQSPLVPKARIVLGDAYLAGGKPDDARALFTQTAQVEPHSRANTDAVARLARMANDAGKYDDVIRDLEARLASATAVEGNDQLYFQLARAYRGAGRPADARRKLNELLDFFKESDVVPAALIALSQVLDEMGMHPEAVQMAHQATIRNPKDAQVLQNEGTLLAAAGDKLKAAEALLAACAAGGDCPELLLAAARQYRGVAPEQAQATYERLAKDFAKSPQAFEGNLELAEILFQKGQTRDGIRRLERLAKAAAEQPQRLPVLLSLAKMYRDLGLLDRASEIYEQAVSMTTEPEVLGQAAVTMLEAGALDEGIAAAAHVDPAKLKDDTAYALLAKQGEALLQTDLKKAIELMERAYKTYPKLRTEELDLQLMKAYVAADDAGRAQALLKDLNEQAQLGLTESPRLNRLMILWADHLYDKKEFKAAENEYVAAAKVGGGLSADDAWAKYQRANALSQLKNYEESVLLFDEVTALNSPCSKQAAINANHIRIEQALQGLPVTPKPKSATAKKG